MVLLFFTTKIITATTTSTIKTESKTIPAIAPPERFFLSEFEFSLSWNGHSTSCDFSKVDQSRLFGEPEIILREKRLEKPRLGIDDGRASINIRVKLDRLGLKKNGGLIGFKRGCRN
jgi:hypothetical protein